MLARMLMNSVVAQAVVQRAQLAFTVVLEPAAGAMDSIPASSAGLSELAVLVTIHEQVGCGFAL
jgi:hypothetical protein